MQKNDDIGFKPASPTPTDRLQDLTDLLSGTCPVCGGAILEVPGMVMGPFIQCQKCYSADSDQTWGMAYLNYWRQT